jgi:hypothetical protein
MLRALHIDATDVYALGTAALVAHQTKHWTDGALVLGAYALARHHLQRPCVRMAGADADDDNLLHNPAIAGYPEGSLPPSVFTAPDTRRRQDMGAPDGLRAQPAPYSESRAQTARTLSRMVMSAHSTMYGPPPLLYQTRLTRSAGTRI